MKKFAYLTVVVWLGLSPCLYAATQAITPEIDLLMQETADEASGKNTGALILLKEVIFKTGGSTSSNYTFHVIGKIFDDAAATQYSQIYIAFNSHYTELKLDFGRSISRDGVVAVTPPNAVQVKNESTGGYSDQRLLAFAIPALAQGSLFEFQAVYTQKVPVIENGWYFPFTFSYVGTGGRMDPVHLSRFTLIHPEHEQFTYEEQNASIEPVVVRKDKTETYRWEIRDIPGITFERDMPSPVHELIPALRVSSLGDWAQVDRWAAGKLISKVQPSPEISKKAEDLVSGAKTSREKIEALFNFVQARVRYIPADLSTGGHTPRPPAEVLNTLFGDCKDQAVLLLSLLKAVDIEAYPALLNAYAGVHYDRIPVPDFNHVIVYIPSPEGDLWLDTTSGVAEFPSLLVQDQGKQAFVVNGTGGKFLITPAGGPDSNQLNLTMKLEYKNTRFVITMNVKAKGAASNLLKSILRASPESARKELLINFYKELGYKGTNVSVEYPDLAKTGAPFSGEAVFEVPYGINPKEAFVYSGNLRVLLNLLLGTSSMVKPEERKYDLRLPYRFTGTMEWLCLPPAEKMKIEFLPRTMEIDNRLISFHETYAKEGEALKARMEVRLEENNIKKEDYQEFYNTVEKIVGQASWKASFVWPRSFWQKVRDAMPPGPFFFPMR